MIQDNKRVIYWKQYDKPKVVYDPIFKTEREFHGEWLSTDGRVEWFAILGGVSARPVDAKMKIFGEMLLKDGTRQSFYEDEIDNKVEERIIERAEQYLKSLP
jgi:hypothetical protein